MQKIVDSITDNFYDYDINKLLTNTTKVTEDEDKDFISIMKSLTQLSKNNKIETPLSRLEVIEMERDTNLSIFFKHSSK